MRGLLGELISRKHELTVVDMEAGLEHLSRSDGTLAYVDELLVVVEPYRRAALTAERTVALARELGSASVALVGNKIAQDEDRAMVQDLAATLDARIAAIVPEDPLVRAADRSGTPLLDYASDTAAVAAIGRLLDDLLAAVASS